MDRKQLYLKLNEIQLLLFSDLHSKKEIIDKIKEFSAISVMFGEEEGRKAVFEELDKLQSECNGRNVIFCSDIKKLKQEAKE